MNSNKPKSLGIICCYGYYDDNLRSEVELNGLNEYVYNVHKDFESSKTDIIVIAGGSTLPVSNLYDSEAESMYKLILDTFENQYEYLLKNSISLSHSEHIAFSVLASRSYWKENGLKSVTIYCDSVFFVKVNALAHGLLNQFVEFKVVPITRKDIHPNHTEEIQNLERLPLEINSNQFHTLKQLVANQF